MKNYGNTKTRLIFLELYPNDTQKDKLQHKEYI